MATIAIDVDDTLYSFANAARQVLTRRAFESGDKVLRTAAYIPWEEWRTPPDLIGVDAWLDVIAETHQDNSILMQDAFPGAYETLTAIQDSGHEIIYVSSRDAKCEPATAKWLFYINDFPQGALTCTSHDKREALRQSQYLVDDRPFTLVNFVTDFNWKNAHGSENQEKARKAFGLVTEFNRNLTDVSDIYLAPTWDGIHDYLVREGVIR